MIMFHAQRNGLRAGERGGGGQQRNAQDRVCINNDSEASLWLDAMCQAIRSFAHLLGSSVADDRLIRAPSENPGNAVAGWVPS